MGYSPTSEIPVGGNFDAPPRKSFYCNVLPCLLSKNTVTSHVEAGLLFFIFQSFFEGPLMYPTVCPTIFTFPNTYRRKY